MSLIEQSLGQLARSIPGATQVLHEYKLDFCCGGQHSLRAAAAAKNLDPVAIEARLQALAAQAPEHEQDWMQASPACLIDHILVRYHERHREQLPELIPLGRPGRAGAC